MTKEEAIYILRNTAFLAPSLEPIDEAIEMACEALRKTENCSEKPNNCETCKWGEWYRKGYDITMMDDECGGCCSWNSKWTPKDEPQTDIHDLTDCDFCKDRNCKDCEGGKDEPQTERSE